MSGFHQPNYLSLRTGGGLLLGRDRDHGHDESEAGWCILCSNFIFNSPRNPGDEGVEVDFGGGSSEPGGPDGVALVEELCHQLKVTDEAFLETLYTGDKLAVCGACQPVIEGAVKRRRECLAMEERLNRLQLQVLKELRRLEEGMGRFYLEVKEIERLLNVKVNKKGPPPSAGDKPVIIGADSFRKRIFEVTKELEVYRRDVSTKLVTPSSPPAGPSTTAQQFPEQVEVKVEPHPDIDPLMFEEDQEPDTNMDWGLSDSRGMEDDNGDDNNYVREDAHSSSERSDSEHVIIDHYPSRSSSSRKKPSRFLPKEIKQDMEWDMNVLDDDEGDDDDASGSDGDYFSTAATSTKAKRGSKLHQPRPRNKKRGRPSLKRLIKDDHESSRGMEDDVQSQAASPPKKKKRIVSVKVVIENKLPGLTKDDRLRIEQEQHDPELEGLSYLRKYFILRTKQDQDRGKGLDKIKISPTDTTGAAQDGLLQDGQGDLLKKSYSLDYDPSGRKLTLNGVQIILNDDDQANPQIQCPICPHNISWSDTLSRLKQRSDHVVASRMEQNIADHILGLHLGAYNCSICGLEMTLWHKYYSHVKYVHLQNETCDICERPGMNRRKLLVHKWTHMSREEKALLHPNPPKRLQEGTVECDICGKQCKSKVILQQHKKLHLPGGNRVICPTCGKSIAKYYYEFYHKKYACHPPGAGEGEGDSNSNPRTNQGVLCTHCPAILKNYYTLKAHIGRMHSTQPEENSQLCTLCGKGFRTVQCVKRHMKSHENEKSWKCGWAGCGAEFTDKRICLEHEATCQARPPEGPELEPGSTFHTGTSTGGGDSEPHKCLHCTATLRNKQLLRQHLKRYHSAEAEARSHKCPICNYGFRMKADLNQHMETHQERIYKCSWGCGKDFNVKRNLKSHEKNCKMRKPKSY